MTAESNRLTFTDTEIRSFLPSGWGIRPSGAGSWDARDKTYQIEVYDLADNVWPLQVSGKEAAARGRLEALQQSIERLCRTAVH